MIRPHLLSATLTAALVFGVGAGFSSVSAQDPATGAGGRGVGIKQSFIPKATVGNVTGSWVGDSDFDRGGSLSQFALGTEGNFPVLAGDRFRFTGGLRYRYNRLEFDGAAFPLASQDFDLHRLSVPFNLWSDAGERWKFWFRLEPGLFSDFDRISSDDLTLTALALASYRWTDTVKVAFGGYFSRDLGEARLLPAVGFIWEPNPRWSLALAMPRFQVVYAPSERWLVTASAYPSGGGWNIADPAPGATGEVDFDYASVRAGLGVDYRVGQGPVWAFAEAGVQFAQNIKLEGGSSGFDEDLDPAPFVNVGLRVRF